MHGAKMYTCRNVHVPKYSCAEMFQCRNIPVPKHPWYRNIPMLKYSRAKISSCQKVLVMKCLCQNVSCRTFRCRNKPKPYKLFPLVALISYQPQCGFWVSHSALIREANDVFLPLLASKDCLNDVGRPLLLKVAINCSCRESMQRMVSSKISV